MCSSGRPKPGSAPLPFGRVMAMALVVAAAAALIASCRPPEGAQRAPVLRFIADDPPRSLDVTRFIRSDVVLDLPPSSWVPDGDETELPATGHGVEARSDSGLARLDHDVELEAEDVGVIEVGASGFRLLIVEWAGAGEPFDEQRRVFYKPPINLPGEEGPYRIVMRGRPGWSGAVRRLRLTLAQKHRVNPPVLQSVRLLKERIDPVGLADAAAETWKLEIDHDVRNVVLGLPGVPIERELVVPRRAELRFGYGLQKKLEGTVTFAVTVTNIGGAPTTVFDAAVDGASETRWRDARVDLSGSAGKRVRISLETNVDARVDLREGVPAWSDPEVVAPAATRLPNVVLISIDTLRADRLSSYGCPRDTTPNLDRWARRRAVVFDHAVVQAPWTLPSHVSLFTGLEPFHHGVNYRETAPASLEMLAEVLRRSGYLTVAVTGGGFVHPDFGFSQGFDSYRYWARRKESERELQDGVDHAMAWLDRDGDRPFFLFFHTFEVHAPYRRRQPYFDRFAPPSAPVPDGVVWVRDPDVRAADGFRRMPASFFVLDETWERDGELLDDAYLPAIDAMYDSGVAYTDEHLARLLDRIDSLGPTMVIITSDHGETLGEHGDAGHGLLDEANQHVPLLVAFSDGSGAGSHVSSQVRLIDLMPTVLEDLGIRFAGALDGSSLRPLVAPRGDASDRPAWCYSAAMNLGISLRPDGDWKYLFNDTAWSAAHGDERLYDLGEDRGEQHNLAAGSPRTPELRARVEEALLGAVGVRLRITNPGPTALFRGEIRSPMIQPARTKRPTLAGGEVRWRRTGLAEITVRPGEVLTISFLDPAEGTISLRGAFESAGWPPRPVPEVDIDPATDNASVRRLLTEAGWTSSEGDDGTGQLVIELWRVGERREATGRPDELDADLRNRLEALGYVQ